VTELRVAFDSPADLLSCFSEITPRSSFHATRTAANGNVNRFLAEKFFQNAELSAIQRKRDNRKFALAPLI
jgi:hypothetical protein